MKDSSSQHQTSDILQDLLEHRRRNGQILVGSDVDTNGRVKTSRTVFTPNSADFHVDLVVNNGQLGEKTSLILEHLETKNQGSPSGNST